MKNAAAIDAILEGLNPQQRRAATHGDGPLLIIAGAGTGKTATLAHRVAWLIARGAEPSRVLLLTFTRRAAAEMQRRAETMLRRLGRPGAAGLWAGTFHAVAARLLHRYAKAVGLDAEFAVHDRPDSEELMDVLRGELNLAKTDKRFPKKGTCMAIYSRCVNAGEKLDAVLTDHFSWCKHWRDELKLLFDAYVDRKQSMSVLDYDDLLLYWRELLDSSAGDAVRKLFDHVLVDEYQDTNRLQAEIIYRLSPAGKGLTVVGDDAQSIYAFRAATVENIFDFPKHYKDTKVIALEQNYRSTQPILEAANRVIALARRRYDKNLFSPRAEGARPALVDCIDDEEQSAFVVRRILELREQGIDLRRQAVLFRASHHSAMLEAELAKAGIPFHKYGGLKFIEAAHVKDLMAFLRLAENPRDVVSGARLLPLLPGVGPSKARQLLAELSAGGGDFGVWAAWRPPAAAAKIWPKFVALIKSLAASTDELPAQVGRVRAFYAPLMELKYDRVEPRLRDLEQLELLAARWRSRRRMLLEMTLDPPSSTQDLAGPPRKDDDFLVLSTIHSAKGLEWDAVYVIHAADGNIPADMATKNADEIEEERRLFYVALTRAKSWLYVLHPQRYYLPGRGDAHTFSQRTRFLPETVVKKCFDHRIAEVFADDDEDDFEVELSSRFRHGVGRRTKNLWR